MERSDYLFTAFMSEVEIGYLLIQRYGGIHDPDKLVGRWDWCIFGSIYIPAPSYLPIFTFLSFFFYSPAWCSFSLCHFLLSF